MKPHHYKIICNIKDYEFNSYSEICFDFWHIIFVILVI